MENSEKNSKTNLKNLSEIKPLDIRASLIIAKENFIKTKTGDITIFYEVIKKIGEGSFGTIYKAKNIESGDIRAMKQVEKEKIVDIDGFKNEIKILSMLDHPNIVRLFEVFEDEKYYFLITELCTGGELLERIKTFKTEHKVPPEREIASIFKQIISAITYCHENGICHRDLKPENILFSSPEPNSPIKVIDFGLSIQFCKNNTMTNNSHLKKLTSKVGTLFYISPEIIKGNYDEKCDLWACGVILYIMICGYPPFNGQTDKEIYKNILSGVFEFSGNEWKSVSKHCKDLIKKLLCPAESRLSGKQVLESKWLHSKSKEKAIVDLLNFDGIKLIEFKFYNKLKKAVLIFIASRLTQEESKYTKELFLAIDQEKTGMLTISDFSKCLLENEQTKDVNEDDIKEMFIGIDIDHNGRIDYTEFLAAYLDKELYMKEEKLKEAFRAFDLEGTGLIAKKDIIRVLNIPDKNEEEVNKLFEENDYNKDGKIDYSDFVKMMEQDINFDDEGDTEENGDKK